MKAKLTPRRILGIVAIGLGVTLMMLSLATLVAANGGVPAVDGLYTGDEANYNELGSADGGRGTLYYNRVGNTLYLLVRVDPSVNDNVFGDSQTPHDPDRAYVQSAGWTHHKFDDLLQSDHVQIQLQCGLNSWTWQQGYLYKDGDEWKSDHLDPSGGSGLGTSPPGYVSHSSLEWNLENTNWDVTLGSTRSQSNWISPGEPVGAPTTVPASYSGFDSTYDWEWAMVYEMSIDVSACGSNAITVKVPSAHNSPSKSGSEDVPICPDGCPLLGSIGDYVWNDVDRDGIQGDNESGIPGVTVELYLDANGDGIPQSGELLDTDVTDENGLYLFTGLAAGNYIVKVADSNFNSGAVLDSYFVAVPNAGSDDTKDSDGHPLTHEVAVTLASGENNMTIDFGFSDCEIGDRVWHDENDDGAQTGTFDQKGLNGVDVYLYDFNPSSCGMSGYLYKTTTISGTSQTPAGFPNGIYGFDMSSSPTGDYWVCVDESTLPSPGLNMQWARTTANPQQVTYTGGDNFSIDFGYIAESIPTAVTLSSFAARSSAGGSASGLWLGLAGLTVLAAGSLLWAKRRGG